MRTIYVACLVLCLAACSSAKEEQEQITIVCTTSIVADAVQNIAPGDVRVIALMGSGVDPHLYKATQGDLDRLQQADLVFYNGLHLEGKMGDVLQKLGRLKPVFAIAQGLDDQELIRLQETNNAYDPHIWFDLDLWSKAVEGARDSLIVHFPEQEEQIKQNYERYSLALDVQHDRAKRDLAAIPEPSRVLVTAHDAFSYFGRAYGLQVMGLQGISTASEYGLNDVSSLVSFISTNKIPAVFVESSVPKRSIEAVIEGCGKRGHDVVLGGQLYSDALGDAGSDAETLIGAFQANVQTIIQGLSPTNP